MAHAASIIRALLVNRVISSVETVEDNLVFAKPLTHDDFKSTVEGQTVTGVGRHGKYFWFRLGSKVVLLHFGMTGWIKVKNLETHYIVMENGGDVKASKRIKEEQENEIKNEGTEENGVANEDQKLSLKDIKDTIGPDEVDSIDPVDIEFTPSPDMDWPPKFHKFILTTDDGNELAFIDPRRLGRIRILVAETDDELMKLEPLSKLGLDYSKKDDRWDLETFTQQVRRRRVPIKALLMDQAVFSGVGNWVADEILYQSRIHPEELACDLTDELMKLLYDSLIYVCTFAVKVEGNTSLFPEKWLMLHRWGKRRKKDKERTAEGYVIEHLTVGGRTSSYAPEVQKKIGTSKSKASSASKPTTKRKAEAAESDEEESEQEVLPKSTRTRSGRKTK